VDYYVVLFYVVALTVYFVILLTRVCGTCHPSPVDHQIVLISVHNEDSYKVVLFNNIINMGCIKCGRVRYLNIARSYCCGFDALFHVPRQLSLIYTVTGVMCACKLHATFCSYLQLCYVADYQSLVGDLYMFETKFENWCMYIRR
jgi:hypothetical protein